MANESGEHAEPGPATGPRTAGPRAAVPRARPLRGRFTAAFFLLLVGPILLGAFVLADVIASAGPAPAQARLSHGAAAARTAIVAECERLTVEAIALAVLASGRTRKAGQTRGAPPARWALCAAGSAPGSGIDALAARREVRDSAGNPVGYEYAVAPIDDRLLNRCRWPPA